MIIYAEVNGKKYNMYISLIS